MGADDAHLSSESDDRLPIKRASLASKMFSVTILLSSGKW